MSTITVRVRIHKTEEIKSYIFSNFGNYCWGDEEGFNKRIKERMKGVLPSFTYEILGYSFSVS